MLLIFGFAVFFRTVGHGDFHCPHCGGDRRYRHRVARRWFTLFFLPVIPLTKAGEVVECVTCRNRFGLGALRLPTAREMEAALPLAMRAAAVLVLTAGDPDDTAARSRAVDAVRGYGAADFDDDALQAAIDERPHDADEVIATAGAQLTTEAREWFLAQAVRIALADGALSDVERGALRLVADRLGLTPAHAFGVIATTEAAARE
ncbi:zinc-ribbon domain-containing protein [Actinoallomurus rhizosphaericola]|uniref:zinc-ribbon domain-containing protein n=1 Tax=Actinoallomurus rhizosphaericola TaxID=2952536 RepID=UPI0020906E2E|nr:zinc-ribbon domain-containing protein [Actinoallomurus rhizosphaericola]MCO5992464.1 zinc-ribbon domain-containing protein [Actinoallomurus rhizosphaericola]